MSDYEVTSERRGEGGFGMRRSFAPVKVGDEVTLKIESIGEKGDGIAKIKGFIIFIPGVKEGQELKVKITRVLNKCGFGEVVGNAEAAASESTEGSAEVECDDEKGICVPKETKAADDDGDDLNGDDDDSDDSGDEGNDESGSEE